MISEILIPVAAILVIFVFLNIPIYIAIFFAAAYLQVFVNGMSMTSIFTGLFEALTKNSLLAIPFFIFAGNIIASSSLGTRLINFFKVILRDVRAGLPISCLLANAIFGAISGSAPAAVATFGKVVYEPLKEERGESMSLGIITSAASLSAVIPPSVAMIIYGIATETSITKLFMGGVIPGLIIVLVVGTYLVIKCKPTPGAVKHPITVEEFLGTLKSSIVVLILPIVVLGSVYGGICTPTESGAICALYALIVGIFITRDIKLKDLTHIFISSAKTSAQVFLLVSTSTALAQAATLAQLPARLTASFSTMGSIQFLLLLNIMLLIVGCFFDTGAAILILAPMLLPTAVALGISPLHLGIVFVVNLSVGMFTPPFGMNIFVAQSVLGRPMGVISKACVPYIVLFILCLFIITYIPQLTLWLPGIIG